MSAKKRKNDGPAMELDHELDQLRAQLERAEKMAALGHLVAGVAHEINTPLGALKSNNDLAVRCLDKIKAALADSNVAQDPELAKLLAQLESLDSVNKTALERIVTLVQNLRNFARLDKGEPTAVDIHAGLDSTLTLVHHKLKNRIRVNKEYGDLPEISGFPNRLNQVFMNVLVNAIQAIDGRGEIGIKTSRENDSAVIEIHDSGKGIPDDIRPHVCEPGFTTKGAEIGTGLGLSIVCQIIEEHDGTFHIDSEVGRGTTVRIELPIR
jgi:two-component system NtrC family sensor kinase